MSDVISREDAIDVLDTGIWGVEWDKALVTAMLKDLPSAERKGHWIQISPAKIYECSVCGQNVMTDDIEAYDYCHGCGARMEGEEE